MNKRSQVLNFLSTQVATAIAAFQGMTERRQSEKRLADYNRALAQQVAERTAALQKSEAKFRAIFENSQVGIFRNRISDGLILNANQRLANLLGFDSPEEIVGLEHSIDYFVNPSDRQQAHELMKRDGELRSFEARLRKRDGTLFWGLFSSYLNAADGYVEGVMTDISDRRQAEEALQRSEAKFRAIFENSQVGIFRTRLSDGLILNANQRFANLLGFDSPEEIVGLEHSIDYFVNPSDRQHAIEVMKRDGELRSYEVQMRKRDGTLFWGLCSSYLNAADGYIEGVMADISDRKQAEEALQRSEAKFRAIFENSQVGIFRVRFSDELILNANQRLADLLGFDSPEEIVGLEHSIDYFVNPSDRQHSLEVLKRDGEQRSFEAQLRKRDGTVFWGLFSSYLNADDDYIEGVLADISDRKRAEVALQISEERLCLALAASNQGLYDMNLKTEEIVVNPGYALMLGYDPATFHETKSRWVESLHPDDIESMAAIYNGFMTGEVPNYRAEYRLRTQDGQWKWILSVGKIVTWNESGEPIRALGVYTDIDDLKRAEAASILEERNRMAREIHDTLAQTFTGILAQVGAANQVLADDLEATQAHLDLIKELARTGLSEARRSVIALRPQLLEEGGLQSALHRLVTQVRAAANDTTLYYEVKGTAYALSTEIESNLLRIGQEALTNAIRHANADEIRVELIYEPDRFLLRVKDDGQGFGVGSIPSSEGFGLLGMSERAEHIDAQLTIRSQPGQGTEIIVTIDREASR